MCIKLSSTIAAHLTIDLGSGSVCVKYVDPENSKLVYVSMEKKWKKEIVVVSLLFCHYGPYGPLYI